MLIVDAQVHIWAADTPKRPWPSGGHARAHRPRPFSKDDLLREMDAAGVARVVIVPPSWEGDRNDLALDAARLQPLRFAVMGRPPLDAADPHALDHWREQSGMLGIRVTTAGAGARELFTEPDGDWLWSAAERNGLPAMVSVPGLLPMADHIAEPSTIERCGDGLEQFCDLCITDQRRTRRRVIFNELRFHVAKWVVIRALDIGVYANVLAGRPNAVARFQFSGFLKLSEVEENVGPLDRRDQTVAELALEIANVPHFSGHRFFV